MPGALTHLIVSLVGFLALTFIFKNWVYGLVFVIGQLIPDAIRVVIAGFVYKTLDLNELAFTPLFLKLVFTHNLFIWISICLFAFVILFILYKLKKINKKIFKEAIIVEIIFFIAIIIHVILDALILETNRWI